jgi:hypothetical protein
MGNGYEGPLPIYKGRPVVFSRPAWAFYLNPEAFGFRAERVRNYLRIQDAFDLAEALKRPLEVEDLEILVQPDGDEVICTQTLKGFRPMAWVLITKTLLSKVKEGETLQDLDIAGALTRVGHFAVRRGDVLCYGGTPYRWHKDSLEDQMAWHSPVTMAYEVNGHRWLMTSEAACLLVASLADRRQGLVSMKDSIARQLGRKSLMVRH